MLGGGVKGAAHIGALKAFEEEKIKFDLISGTSSGSIVSTLYAMEYKSDEIYEIFKKYCKKIKYVDLENIFKFIFGIFTNQKIIMNGFNSGNVLEKIIKKIADEKNIKLIKDIKMPLYIPSVDLHTRSNLYFLLSKTRKKIFRWIYIYR